MSIDETAAIPLARKHLRSLGVTAEAGNLANAAAVGITQMVWRNGPIEDAHAGARGRRNGLHDGVMFARNTWFYHQALTAVTSPQRYALHHFEESILDRALVWPGTTDTLTRFGYGALSAIKKHTRQRVDHLLYLEETYPREEFWLLAAIGSLRVPGHFGVPRWEPRVRAAARRRRGEDPAFVEWLAHDYDRDFSALLATAPAVVRDDVDEVERALLIAPYELGEAVLRWFAWNPVLLPLPAKSERYKHLMLMHGRMERQSKSDCHACDEEGSRRRGLAGHGVQRWSRPPRSAGARSTHPTSSHSSAPEPRSNAPRPSHRDQNSTDPQGLTTTHTRQMFATTSQNTRPRDKAPARIPKPRAPPRRRIRPQGVV